MSGHKKALPTLALKSSMPIQDFTDAIIDRLKVTEIDLSPTGFGTWCHSKLKSFSSCYLSFLLKNILKIEYTLDNTEVENQDSLKMKYTGLFAHGLLEDMVKGKTFDESFLHQKSLYLDHFDEEGFATLYELKDRLEMFKDRFDYFCSVHKVSSYRTEQKLAIDKDHNPTAFNSKNAYFRGILDLSLFLGNGDVVLFDHKNGGSAEHGLRNYESQLKSQSLLLAVNEPKARGVVPFIHFIQEGGIAGGRYKYSRDRILDEFLRSIDSRVQGSLEILKEKGSFKQSSGNHCKYCEFSHLCKTGKRGSGGLLKPIIDESKLFFRG